MPDDLNEDFGLAQENVGELTSVWPPSIPRKDRNCGGSRERTRKTYVAERVLPSGLGHVDRLGDVFLGLPGRLIGPVVGHKGWRLCPWRFDQSRLKPFVSKVGVLRDNDLEAGRVLSPEAVEELEKTPYCLEIRILFRLLYGAVRFCIVRLRQEIDLCWLINKKKPRQRLMLIGRESMQGKQSSQMVSKMIFAASSAGHVDRTSRSVDHNTYRPCGNSV